MSSSKKTFILLIVVLNFFLNPELKAQERYFIPTGMLNILPGAKILKFGKNWSVIQGKNSTGLKRSNFPYSLYRTQKLKVLLNKARTKAGFPSSTEYSSNCSDVVVGIIDTGIDLYHPDFLYENGYPVFAYVWDQTDDTGSPPEGFTYGNECDTYDIIKGDCFVDDSDLTGHGTHITGILASRNKKFKGLCSDAVFIFVKAIYEEPEVIDAVCYISKKAREFKLPFVANLSLGGQYGPHDGTTPFEQSLLECAGDSGIIVAAAGNDGNKIIHCGGNFTPLNLCKSYYASFSIFGRQSFSVEVWTKDFEEGECFAVLLSQNKPFYTTEGVKNGELKEFISNEGEYPVTITIDARDSPSFMNGDSHCTITFTGINLTSNSFGTGFKAYDGEAEVDQWVTEGFFSKETTKAGDFSIISGDDLLTVNIPATSEEIIAVGSFVSKNSWRDENGILREESVPLDGLSSFSSKGPSRKNTYIKPDITAPGQVVFSTKAENSYVSSSYIDEDGIHSALWGTSIATPFVTGAVAEILSLNSDLKRKETIDLLHLSAVSDYYTEQTPNEKWGYGKLNFINLKEKTMYSPVEISTPVLKKVEVYPLNGSLEIIWEASFPARGWVEYYNDLFSSSPSSLSSPTMSDKGLVLIKGIKNFLFHIKLEGKDKTIYDYGPFRYFGENEKSFGCSYNKLINPKIQFLILILIIYLLKIFFSCPSIKLLIK